MGSGHGWRLLGGTLVIGVACTIVSCGGGGGSRSTPTAPPVTPPPTPPSTAGTLRGVVLDTSTGARVPGARLALDLPSGRTTLEADGSGAWEFAHAGPLPTGIGADVSAPGYLTRNTRLRWGTGTRADIAVDLIREAEPFSLTFYRELVRNLFDDPEAAPEPIRRWTQNPNFYIDTRNPRMGGVLAADEVERVVTIIREAVPVLSGGRLQAGIIETGAEARALRAGFITIRFIYDPAFEGCGLAYVGSNPGEIELQYGIPEFCGSRCGNFPWRTVAHEIGHAMGFWHVSEGFIMNTTWFDRDCDKTAFSPAERHHAAIAYARPNGNRDPDVDPATTLLLQPERPPVRLACR